MSLASSMESQNWRKRDECTIWFQGLNFGRRCPPVSQDHRITISGDGGKAGAHQHGQGSWPPLSSTEAAPPSPPTYPSLELCLEFRGRPGLTLVRHEQSATSRALLRRSIRNDLHPPPSVAPFSSEELDGKTRVFSHTRAGCAMTGPPTGPQQQMPGQWSCRCLNG